MDIENTTDAAPRGVGKPLVVAVGNRGVIQTSENGWDFTKLNQLSFGDLTAITWSRDLQRFVCLGSHRGQGFSYTSSDGISWGGPYQSKSSRARRILWSDEFSFFIAVGSNGIIEISKDGIDWELMSSKTSDHLFGLAWNDEAKEFVVVGDGVILTSKDGEQWVLQNTDIKYQLRDVAWSGEQYIAVTDTKKVFFSSPDGKEWTEKSDENLRSSRSILWCKGFNKYFITGTDASICSSDNGENWEELNPGFTFLNHEITTIMWSEPFQCLLAADQTGYLYSSTSSFRWVDTSLSGNVAFDQAINSMVQGWAK